MQKRSQLLVEEFLLALGADFISPIKDDFGADFIAFFNTEFNTKKIITIEIKATEKPVGATYSTTGKTLQQYRHRNVPTLLLLVNTKTNTIYFSWIERFSENITKILPNQQIKIPITQATPNEMTNLKKKIQLDSEIPNAVNNQKVQLLSWIRNAMSIERNDLLSDIFCTFLETVTVNKWQGACHDVSAALYLVLSEYGFLPDLCIGVITSTDKNISFDHSWVEIEGKIYDVTICHPLIGGAYVSGPIYESINLDTMELTKLIHGNKNIALDPIGKTVADSTLGEYSQMLPSNNSTLWDLAAEIGSSIPDQNPHKKKLNSISIREKYSMIKRKLKL